MEIFIFAVFLLPAIGFLIYSVFHPEETVMLGQTWRFKNRDLEPSEAAVDFERFWAIVSLIILGIILIAALAVYLTQGN